MNIAFDAFFAFILTVLAIVGAMTIAAWLRDWLRLRRR